MTTVESIYPEIGRNIQCARDARGMSQASLGARLMPPLTRASIANMEGGKQRILVHTLLSIAQILAVPLSDLLPYTDSQMQAAATPAEIKEVRKDLLRHLSKATADRVLNRMTEEQNNESTIRTPSRRKAARRQTE